MLYKVQTSFFGLSWENVWRSNGKLETFDTLDDAIDAIRDHIIDCINAVESGAMDDSPAQDAFRIVDGNNIYEWTGTAWEYEICLPIRRQI